MHHGAHSAPYEIITPADADFPGSGLKVPILPRLSRLIVLDDRLLVGSIGAISDVGFSGFGQ